MNLPSQNQIIQLLINEFRQLGLERDLGSLQIRELDKLTEAILAAVVDAQQDDEPPF
jgi:hypothetical protein